MAENRAYLPETDHRPVRPLVGMGTACRVPYSLALGSDSARREDLRFIKHIRGKPAGGGGPFIGNGGMPPAHMSLHASVVRSRAYQGIQKVVGNLAAHHWVMQHSDC